jgi:hypothetical protein
MCLTFCDELYSLMNVSNASADHFLFYHSVVGLADLFLRPKLQLLYLHSYYTHIFLFYKAAASCQLERCSSLFKLLIVNKHQIQRVYMVIL